MRGKVYIRTFSFDLSRITPAYAGKSIYHACNSYQIWDHPRLCGEKAAVPFLIAISMGSPPPMRGKVLEKGNFLRRTGITPAYAGKSDKHVPCNPAV